MRTVQRAQGLPIAIVGGPPSKTAGSSAASSWNPWNVTASVFRQIKRHHPNTSGAGDVPVGLVVELEALAPQSLGYRTPEAVETEYYTNQATQAASL